MAAELARSQSQKAAAQAAMGACHALALASARLGAAPACKLRAIAATSKAMGPSRSSGAYGPSQGLWLRPLLWKPTQPLQRPAAQGLRQAAA